MTSQNNVPKDCSSDESSSTVSGRDAKCPIGNKKALCYPIETQQQHTQGSTNSLTPNIGKGAKFTNAVSQTTHFLGRRGLPQRVEADNRESFPDAFMPYEDECFSRPPTAPLANLRHKTTIISITSSGHISLLALPQQRSRGSYAVTLWGKPRSFYHRLSLRWLDYLKYLPKHHKWKASLHGYNLRTQKSSISIQIKLHRCSQGKRIESHIGPVTAFPH